MWDDKWDTVSRRYDSIGKLLIEISKFEGNWIITFPKEFNECHLGVSRELAKMRAEEFVLKRRIPTE